MDDDKDGIKKINALIQAKLNINPLAIDDVEDWIDAYAKAEYVMKTERLMLYSAFKQAATEIVNAMFSKENAED
ncbi:hypothetical protein ATE49_04355 [Elizabethkingia miricola]|uniref:Uncharacterized protein n=1 Tax=Elizabethkingia miricola TaxID=172045 RepID=A0ABY3NAL4_ELIMR|nr:hypothetical protein [Elizabethkingia miricola]MDV3675133.1 hypothetical protein [Elizabethkingia anophelis]MDV3682209.1 hypothetical protein [Elizabethkingia anophelis]MDV3701865.1 hypothetical protein [Elizabethkingia anophelis]MDV3761171.1 hypothetical protein [Elizabethkingia anophelis]MDV3800367.1 hypothetical protein [Elizabethkingia anophelis]